MHIDFFLHVILSSYKYLRQILKGGSGPLRWPEYTAWIDKPALNYSLMR